MQNWMKPNSKDKQKIMIYTELSSCMCKNISKGKQFWKVKEKRTDEDQGIQWEGNEKKPDWVFWKEHSIYFISTSYRVYILWNQCMAFEKSSLISAI